MEEKEPKATSEEGYKKSKIKYILGLIGVAILSSGLTITLLTQFQSSSTYSNTQLEQFYMNNLYQLIESMHIDEVDTEQLYEGAMKGMVEAIDDPYSSFFSASEAKTFDDDINGNFEGIGATMTMTNNLPTIAEPPIKDSPAEKAKLQPGDVILQVDGESVEDLTLSEVVKLVRGEKGTDVTLEIKRDAETFPVTITRDVIPVDSVKGNIDKQDPTVGYIQITAFNTTTSDEFNAIVTDLREQGAESFIVDVRGNPGGVLSEVEAITSRFLEDGQTIVRFEDKNGDETEDISARSLDEGEKITEPTVLLVDNNSASASEIMAGAFKESGNIPVIGTQTFGKGTVQTIFPIGNGSEVKLTIKKWLTPDGNWIHEEGVEPSVKVELPEYIQNRVIKKDNSYQVGNNGEDVKIINQYLSVLGYGIDETLDTYSVETESAVKKFQEEKTLSVTGVVDSETALELEKEIFDYWKENDTQYEKAKETLKKEQ